MKHQLKINGGQLKRGKCIYKVNENYINELLECNDLKTFQFKAMETIKKTPYGQDFIQTAGDLELRFRADYMRKVSNNEIIQITWSKKGFFHIITFEL